FHLSVLSNPIWNIPQTSPSSWEPSSTRKSVLSSTHSWSDQALCLSLYIQLFPTYFLLSSHTTNISWIHTFPIHSLVSLRYTPWIRSSTRLTHGVTMLSAYLCTFNSFLLTFSFPLTQRTSLVNTLFLSTLLFPHATPTQCSVTSENLSPRL